MAGKVGEAPSVGTALPGARRAIGAMLHGDGLAAPVHSAVLHPGAGHVVFSSGERIII